MAAEYAFDLNYIGSAAPQEIPQLLPETQPQPRLHKIPQPKRSHRQQKQQEQQSHLKAAKLFGFMALAIVLFGVFCNSMVAKMESRTALERANAKLAEQQEIATVLENDLSNLVTADTIDKIAASLGLVKVQSGSEVYLDLDGNNRVRISQGN